MTQDNYEITIVKFGTRSTTKSDVYLNFHINGLVDEPIEMDYFFWVIRNAERTVLVDTGFSKHGGEVRNRTFLISPLAAYESLGIDVDSALDIVVTHAHYDHIGNLDMFPHSRIVLAQAELDFWLSEFAERRQFKHSIEVDELNHLAEAAVQDRVQTFDEHFELAPGITLTRVGGHTPGQLIVTVKTSDGEVVLASDAIHYYEEYEHDLPFMFVNDVQEMYAGFDTVRRLMETTATHLVTGHDPSTIERFTAVTTGPLAGLAATIGTVKELHD
jgi:glyoxylase-like metal-dependent hydrolase (beta-lactamase superfamily II)